MKTYELYSGETQTRGNYTMQELCEIAAKKAKKMCKGVKTIDRKSILMLQLEIVFNNAKAPFNLVACSAEKPAKGAAFSVINLKDRFRINYRCGYSRHNYAPCVEVLVYNWQVRVED